MQPGDTFNPSSDSEQKTEAPVAPNNEATPPQVPAELPQPVVAPTSPEPSTLNQPGSESQWSYNDSDTPQVPGIPTSVDINWTASEFISHQKGGSWYGMLGILTALGAVVVYFLTRDVISTGMVIMAVIILGVFAARQPRTLQYRLSKDGISIGQKLYPYHLFKSFSVIDEGAINSIQLMPLKRFMPAISMYYAPDDERTIADTLSYFLPYEAREHDMVDKFMRKIRF